MFTGRSVRRAAFGLNTFVMMSMVQRSQCSTKAARSTCDVTFFQYKICPFCHRVKAYMDYTSTPYSTVEVNPLTKKEIKFSNQLIKFGKRHNTYPTDLLWWLCMSSSLHINYQIEN